jgi:hypothetical protein
MARRQRNKDVWTNGYDDQPVNDEPALLVNSDTRADTIRAAAQYIASREAEIKVIRDELTEYKNAHIKGDLGFKLSDWATVYRIFKLEGDDRNQLIDTLREGFAALGLGQSVDWVAAAETQDRDNALQV